jgi:Uma2 family endonuclease
MHTLERQMTATGIRMTADELFHLPDNGMRRELIAGELHEMPPAGSDHGYTSLEIAFYMRTFLAQHPEIGGRMFAAETGFRLSRHPDTVRAPDVAYVSKERVQLARGPGFAEMAPDLVVEVVSPNDRASEVQAKVDEWLRAGVLLVWVLYPTTRTAMVYRADGTVALLHADDTITGGPVLPGFACRVGDLF